MVLSDSIRNTLAQLTQEVTDTEANALKEERD